jgi:hypothetical protein
MHAANFDRFRSSQSICPSTSGAAGKQSETQQKRQPEEEKLTDDQLAVLANPKLQEDYRRAYLLQQARRCCPGCGEDYLPL